VPVFLLRNVCYFCDSNGIQALAACFRESDPEILPCSVAHTLITICANVSK
jgi:ubiquitin carboxyl-terminal hydrolase 34